MANRDWKPVRAGNREPVMIVGYFTVDGSSAVSAQTPSGTLAKGGLFTVTKPAGTGIYQVQTDGFYDYLYVDAVIVKSAGTFDGDIQPVSLTPSTGIVQYQVRKTSDGSALNPTSVTIMFIIVGKNSSVSP